MLQGFRVQGVSGTGHVTVFRNPYKRPIDESTSAITSAKASAAFPRLAGYFH